MKKQEQLKNIRRSMSHLMALAVKEFYPEVKKTIGAITENGFYCDFDFGNEKVGEEILIKIKKKIKFLIKQNLKIEEIEIDIDEAIENEKQKNEIYEVELLEDLKKKGEKKASYCKIGSFENLSRDLCVDSTKYLDINAFKIDKIAGAYWKGDEKNNMLTRIYGVVFTNQDELNDYLKKVKEASERDHRKIGKKLDLFHIDKDVGLGLPLFHPKGAMLWRLIEDFWYQEHFKGDYEFVKSPHVGNKSLWEKSGHWNFYNDSMYPPIEIGQSLEEKQKNKKVKESEKFLLKAMNCPFHVQIYKNSSKSYKDLPIRLCECSTVYRFEKKGELSGLTRVRGFTQDDAHIICRTDQVEEELNKVVDFIFYIFNIFGFSKEQINVYLSLRDPDKKEKYAGDDKGWEFTETMMRRVAKSKKLNFTEEEGEAAFYGPKLDFKLKDILGREWQCSTLQYDFNLPKRFNMFYINNKGLEERPYMLHRALFGSFERFIALLIENCAGAFPVWLSPTQVKIISVSEKHIEYCKELAQRFKHEYIRVELDGDNETVGNKIRKASQEKIPYILVIGDNEIESSELTIRDRGKRETRKIAEIDFIEEIKNCVKEKK